MWCLPLGAWTDQTYTQEGDTWAVITYQRGEGSPDVLVFPEGEWDRVCFGC